MENLELGLYTTGMGMVIVFLGLLFLMYIMMALAFVGKTGSKKQAPSSNKVFIREQIEIVSEDPVEEEKPVHAEVAQPVKAEEPGNLGEVAAIAAVMAILTSEGVHGVVTSVKQVGAKASSWAFAGRRDIMASRL